MRGSEDDPTICAGSLTAGIAEDGGIHINDQRSYWVDVKVYRYAEWEYGANGEVVTKDDK